MEEIMGAQMTPREINATLKAQIAQGKRAFRIRNPAARHNLGVAILQPVYIDFAGSVGYYCGGMIDGPTIDIRGSAGWGVAESMLIGTVTVHGHAGNGAAAAMRDGTVIIHGDAAARAGVSMKGGVLLIGGSCGYMTGFMAQKGRIIVCGNAGPAFADSMYETICYVGGQANDLGNDAVFAPMTEEDLTFLQSTMSRYLPHADQEVTHFKKVVAGRKLWNFEKHERAVWRQAL